MIASVKGTVLEVGLFAAVVDVNGIGMRVLATPATLSSLRVGEEARLATELIVREDSMTLYGFENTDERDCFTTLLGAKGVGAKLALAMLTVHTPDALRRAVANQDVAALKRVPGLGPKGAQRVILDIGDKLGPVRGDGIAAVDSPAPTPVGEPNADVVAALTQLGWNESMATQAVNAVETELSQSVEGSGQPAPDTAAVLRAALRWLGSGRRG